MPPVNDLLTGAISVDLDGDTLAGTTTDATDTGDTFRLGFIGTPGICDRTYLGPSVWYVLQPGSDMSITVSYVSHSYTGGTNGLYAELFLSLAPGLTSDGCDLVPFFTGSYLTSVGGGEPDEFTLDLDAGETYYLYVGNWDQDDSQGTFTLQVGAGATANAEDEATGALEITKCEIVSGSTVGMTESADDSSVGVVGPSIWYKFTPLAAETLAFRLLSSSGFDDFGAEFKVFEGPHTLTDYADLTFLPPTVDQESGGQDAVDIDVDPAFSYYIGVSSYSDETVYGSFQLTVCDPPEPAAATNDTCADARALTGESGFVFGDNRLASYESPDPLFHAQKVDSPGITAHVGGRSVWYRFTASIDCRVTFTLETNPYQGFKDGDGDEDPSSAIGVFKGNCADGLCAEPGDERGPRFGGSVLPAYDINALGFGGQVGIGLFAGETCYIEVDGYHAGNTSEPPANTPSSGRFRLSWQVYAASLTDKPRTDCGALDAADSNPVDGTIDTVHDYVKTDDGVQWRIGARTESLITHYPIVSRWDGASETHTEYVLPGPSAPDTLGGYSGLDNSFCLETDGETVWAIVLQNVEVENPYQCKPSDDDTWRPNRVAVFEFTGDEFEEVLVIPALSNNAGATLLGDLTGATGALATCAHRSHPGKLYIVWSEEGHEGANVRSGSGEECDVWLSRLVVATVGSGFAAPTVENAFIEEVPDRHMGGADPYHSKTYNCYVSSFCQIVSDHGQPVLFLVPSRPLTVGGEVHQVPNPTVKTYIIGDDASLSLTQTMDYEAPSDDFPTADYDLLDDNVGVGALGVEPLSHVDPWDGTRIRYVLVGWQGIADSGSADAVILYRIRTDTSEEWIVFDDDPTICTPDPTNGAPISVVIAREVSKKIYTDRTNEVWLAGKRTNVYHFDRKCHPGWILQDWPQVKNGKIDYIWRKQESSSKQWRWEEQGRTVVVGGGSGGTTGGHSGGGHTGTSPSDPPVAPASMISSPGLLTNSATPGDLASMVAHDYEWISYQVYNNGSLINRDLGPARSAGFRNVGVWGVIDSGDESASEAVKTALFYNGGKAFAEQAIRVGADHLMVDSEFSFKFTRSWGGATPLLDGIREGGWEGPVHLTPLGCPSGDVLSNDFEYDTAPLVATGGGIFPQAYYNDFTHLSPERCHTYWTRFHAAHRINYMIGIGFGIIGPIPGADWVPLLEAASVERNFCIFLAENCSESDFAGLDALTLTDEEPAGSGPGAIDYPGPTGEDQPDELHFRGVSIVRFGGGSDPVRTNIGGGGEIAGSYMGRVSICRNCALCTVSDIPYVPPVDVAEGLLFIDTVHRAELTGASAAGLAATEVIDFGRVSFRAEESDAAPASLDAGGIHFSGVRFRAATDE